MTAASQAAAVARGETSALDLVEAALSRLEVTDTRTRAFVHVAADRSRDDANQRDDDVQNGRLLGPLHGVPVAVKDLFDVTGEVTTAGSLVPPGPAAVRDAIAVQRLRDAGAIVIGRTRTHEFAWGLTTQHPVLGGTHNPYDVTRVTGGSSGGSAAAVATGVVAIALGTDTAGSIRLPAAWCGLVGHKPTWGLVPAGGVLPLAPTCDHVGALTADVTDARIVLGVLAGGSFVRARQVATGLRVGVVGGYGAPIAKDVAAAVDRVLATLLAAGADLREIDHPDPHELQAVFFAVQAGEALAWHRETGRWPAYADRYGADVAARLRLAETIDVAAAQRRDGVRAAAADIFCAVDVLVMPVAAAGPSTVVDPDHLDVDGIATDLRHGVLPFTLLASLGGLPACSVPAGVDSAGLPIGVQLIAAKGADTLVLDVAELIAGAP